MVTRAAPADVAGTGARKQADYAVRAQTERGFADQVAVLGKKNRPLFEGFAVVVTDIDANRAEVFIRQFTAGAGEHDGAIRQQHAVVARVSARDVRGMRRQPGAPAVLRFAHPEFVPAVAPGGKIYLGVEKLRKQQGNFAFLVLDPDRVVTAVANVAADRVGIRPVLSTGFQNRDPILRVATHRVAVPLQKAAVPNGQQVSVVRHGEARHMIALPLVKPFHNPFTIDDLCLHKKLL